MGRNSVVERGNEVAQVVHVVLLLLSTLSLSLSTNLCLWLCLQLWLSCHFVFGHSSRVPLLSLSFLRRGRRRALRRRLGRRNGHAQLVEEVVLQVGRASVAEGLHDRAALCLHLARARALAIANVGQDRVLQCLRIHKALRRGAAHHLALGHRHCRRDSDGRGARRSSRTIAVDLGLCSEEGVVQVGHCLEEVVLPCRGGGARLLPLREDLLLLRREEVECIAQGEDVQRHRVVQLLHHWQGPRLAQQLLQARVHPPLRHIALQPVRSHVLLHRCFRRASRGVLAISRGAMDSALVLGEEAVHFADKAVFLLLPLLVRLHPLKHCCGGGPLEVWWAGPR
mmetsp:Transcript_4695/g.16524  ORF Transcript_4695/g.16524 Transcript_4695/m.16524 type:complete len:339 (-) Transcript_4695:295-1311(-)